MCNVIAVLVAALLDALVNLVGTGNTAIFNCQLGGHVLLNSILHLSGGSRVSLSAQIITRAGSLFYPTQANFF